MNERNTTHTTLHEVFLRKGETDWERLRKDQATGVEPEVDPDESKFDESKARAFVPRRKQAVSVRLDPDTIEFFRADGHGYQTRINAALRLHMNSCRKRKAMHTICKLSLDERDAYQMTARMLSQAASLRRAAEILDQAYNEAGEGRNQEDFSAAFHGAPILRAQSAEIALKALWRIGRHEERGEPPRHHNLTKLHDAQTKTIQKLLAEEFPEIRDPSCPHFPIPVRQGLRTILNEHETALKDWRYAYELGSLRFAHVFDEVLNTLISVGWQQHNLWLRKLREEDAHRVRARGESLEE